jgi:quinol monooxygenase YgiN
VAFVRAGEFRALPDTYETVRSRYQELAIPLIRSAPGNLSALMLQRRDAPDRFLAITVWETEEAAEEYEKSGKAGAAVDAIRFALAGPPTLTTYDADWA